MPGRKSLQRIFPIFVMIFSLAIAGFPRAARGAEEEFTLVVRNEGREIKMSMAEIAKLPRASVRAKDEKGKGGMGRNPAPRGS